MDDMLTVAVVQRDREIMYIPVGYSDRMHCVSVGNHHMQLTHPPRGEGLTEVAALCQLLVQLSPRSKLQYDIDPCLVPEVTEHAEDIALSTNNHGRCHV